MKYAWSESPTSINGYWQLLHAMENVSTMSKQISISKQPSESLTLLNVSKDSELLKKAETLIDFRGYNLEKISQTPSTIDIHVSHPDSEDAIMMQIVTQTNHKNNGVGANTVKDTEQLLAKPDIDKVIIFGTRFTESAKNELRGEGIEFFSPTQNILSTLNQQELYTSILKHVDALCLNTCGSTPQSSADCIGYTKQITPCPQCDGRGKLLHTSSKYAPYCPKCGGSGEKEGNYRCPIRLISDNADFHYRKDWRRLLHNNLLSLINLASSKQRLLLDTNEGS
jgi:hypothetical protein